jgi:hypothetical protein
MIPPPDAQFQPGPFPIEALSEIQRRVVESVAEVYQIPIELGAMPVLSVTSGALGKAWKITGAVNGRENYGNIYVIPGAPKSHGKRRSEKHRRRGRRSELC